MSFSSILQCPKWALPTLSIGSFFSPYSKFRSLVIDHFLDPRSMEKTAYRNTNGHLHRFLVTGHPVSDIVFMLARSDLEAKVYKGRTPSMYR